MELPIHEKPHNRQRRQSTGLSKRHDAHKAPPRTTGQSLLSRRGRYPPADSRYQPPLVSATRDWPLPTASGRDHGSYQITSCLADLFNTPFLYRMEVSTVPHDRYQLRKGRFQTQSHTPNTTPLNESTTPRILRVRQCLDFPLRRRCTRSKKRQAWGETLLGASRCRRRERPPPSLRPRGDRFRSCQS